MKNNIPFQKMLSDVPIQVFRLSELQQPASLLPHRHAFYMLFWTVAGKGSHRVNFRDYDLTAGTVFFMHEGQVHQILAYPSEGWIILFRQTVFRDYLRQNPAEEQSGLFDFFNREPFVILPENVNNLFSVLLPALQNEVKAMPFHRCVSLNLGVLLCQANRLSGPVLIDDPENRELVRKLKVLVDEHFRTKRFAPFYSDRLGISTRKLNAITEKYTGKLVNDLISDRLLSEAEALLGATQMPMKQIVAELAFNDHSHFTVFFRRAKGLTPTEFRQKMHDYQTNATD